MKQYIEITLLPNTEVPLYFLWQKFYQQLHLALVENKNSQNRVNIGVSFPEYDAQLFQLGHKLRLFGMSKKTLEALNIEKYVSRLFDYIDMTSILNVPDKVEGYAYFKRIQVKSNHERLARRKAKRANISLEEASVFFKGKKETYSRAPYIHLKSLSSDKSFRLMIVRIDTSAPTTKADFTTYGLSSTSAIPIFTQLF